MVIKKNTFAGLQLLNTFCLPCAYEIGLLCSAHAALVRACTANRIYAYSAEASLNGNVFVQPCQNDTGRNASAQGYFGGIVS